MSTATPPFKKKPVLGVGGGGGQKSMISELLEIFFGSSGDPGLSVGTLISCVRQKLLDLYSAEVGPTVNFWFFWGIFFTLTANLGSLYPLKPLFSLQK